jgi:Arc/MetJ-type ribon-helix-helix transcriptional regulator
MTNEPVTPDRPKKASRFLIVGDGSDPLDSTEREGLCCASGEALVEAIRHALTDREHVVMVRVNDPIRDQLDMLVEAGICKSRSSAATFMIREGIKANEQLFGSVEGTTKRIADLRRDLHELIGELPSAGE